MNTKPLSFPTQSAFNLAKKMREFRASTELTAQSENNQYAEQDRVDVVRNIDWSAYDKIIEELEYMQMQINKHGRN